ncbi:DUF1697 domain-containing protein [Nocardioides gilvus]|uniref:DUF1697 domain-containing protein n=1 Tax=Nocardioides gilvus TaxID=1735589 RepID=UPI000D745F10|nr:DUF1697 domain-containing protein [Nocardioides gilvus]
MARTHLALLRGINVGGSNKVPMAELRAMAARLGWKDVATHVNSGNLVFSDEGKIADLEAALSAEVETFLGKPVQVLVLTASEWIDAVEQCPYKPTEDKFVHLQVHRSPLPEALATAMVEDVSAAGDGTEMTVTGRWVYLHTPMGLSKSVAFTKSPRALSKNDPGTARNLNSSKAIAALLRASA